MISAGITEIGLYVFRDVVVRDINIGAGIIKFCEINIYKGYGEELLINLFKPLIITVFTAILIGTSIATVVGITRSFIAIKLLRRRI